MKRLLFVSFMAIAVLIGGCNGAPPGPPKVLQGLQAYPSVAVIAQNRTWRGNRDEGLLIEIEDTFAGALRGNGFQVPDRSNMTRALEEMKLGRAGFLDDATVAQIGKMVGASALLVATITNCRTDRFLSWGDLTGWVPIGQRIPDIIDGPQYSAKAVISVRAVDVERCVVIDTTKVGGFELVKDRDDVRPAIGNACVNAVQAIPRRTTQASTAPATNAHVTGSN